MQNENRLVPDFRPESTETHTETYTPAGGVEQTATYKIGGAHPIIGGILDKFTWMRTHVAAVWWNKLAGITLKSKIEQIDNAIAQLNGKLIFSTKTLLFELESHDPITKNFSIDLSDYKAIYVFSKINGYGDHDQTIIIKENLFMYNYLPGVCLSNKAYSNAYNISFNRNILSGVIQLSNDYMNGTNKISSILQIYGLN